MTTNTPPAARTARVLSYDEARLLLDAALSRATEIGVPASVAVLDVSREIVAFGRQIGPLFSPARWRPPRRTRLHRCASHPGPRSGHRP